VGGGGFWPGRTFTGKRNYQSGGHRGQHKGRCYNRWEGGQRKDFVGTRRGGKERTQGQVKNGIVQTVLVAPKRTIKTRKLLFQKKVGGELQGGHRNVKQSGSAEIGFEGKERVERDRAGAKNGRERLRATPGNLGGTVDGKFKVSRKPGGRGGEKGMTKAKKEGKRHKAGEGV